VSAESLAVGDHRIILTATDADGASARDSVAVHITPGGPVIVELEWVSLAQGTFMGSPDEEPGTPTRVRRGVTVSASDHLDRGDATTTRGGSGAPRAGSSPCPTPWSRARAWATTRQARSSLGESRILYASGLRGGTRVRTTQCCVTWYGDAFSIDQRWRLPTEPAEYACRAGSATASQRVADRARCTADLVLAMIAGTAAAPLTRTRSS
jgi:hypothetical protein